MLVNGNAGLDVPARIFDALIREPTIKSIKLIISQKKSTETILLKIKKKMKIPVRVIYLRI